MSETWHIFGLDELDSISFECPGCHTKSVFGESDALGQTERQCPGCNKPIPRAGEILHLYRSLLNATKSAAEHEHLTVKIRAKQD